MLIFFIWILRPNLTKRSPAAPVQESSNAQVARKSPVDVFRGGV
jgi:hypothetical protein